MRLCSLEALLGALSVAFPAAARESERTSWLATNFPCLEDCPTISKAELAQHGPGGKQPMLLSIFGHALNVTGGERFYAIGGSYEFLAGKDATRAFATGKTSKAALKEDVSDQFPRKLGIAKTWLLDLSEKYPFVGIVTGGHFYHANGTITEDMEDYLGKLRHDDAREDEEEAWSKDYPRCNSDGKGGMYCGIQGGKPMRVLQPGRREEERRCACVREPATRPIMEPIFKAFPECEKEGMYFKCWLMPREKKKVVKKAEPQINEKKEEELSRHSAHAEL